MKFHAFIISTLPLLVSFVRSIPANPSYNASLSPFPVMYSDAEKAAQLTAGQQLTNTLNNLWNNISSGTYTKTSYTVKPGVYRFTERVNLNFFRNFKLIMSNVEIITTTNDASFWFYNVDHLTIQGPLYLDADPLPNSQNVIVGTDLQTYVDVVPMPGYPPPLPYTRIMCFTPSGLQLPHYQDSASSVDNLSNGTYRMYFGSDTFLRYPSYAAAYFTPGNYLSAEPGPRGSGGFNLQQVGNLTMTQIYHYAPNLIFCQNTQGTLRLDKWMGQRRPGTNRLNAGGWTQCQFDGGSLDMTNSEISYNWDDLTDMNGYMSAALSGPTTTQLYLNAAHLSVGRAFHFYDAFNLVDMGTASIVSIDNTSVSDSVLARAQNATDVAQMRSITDQLALVTMSSPVSGYSGLYLADDILSRPKLLSIRNSYLHDGLAAGISMHGADSVIATGNTIQRSALGCMNSGFTAYWLEGGPPKSVLFQNNTCLDSPYSVPIWYTSTSIRIFTEYEQILGATNTGVSRNITIANNSIYRPQTGAIEIMVSQGVTITGNKIYDPFFFPVEWSVAPWVISAQSSNLLKVTSNVVYRANSTNGINGSNFVVANSVTPKSGVSLSGNLIYTGGVRDVIKKFVVGLLTTY